jgi:hypothetical protein
MHYLVLILLGLVLLGVISQGQASSIISGVYIVIGGVVLVGLVYIFG